MHSARSSRSVVAPRPLKKGRLWPLSTEALAEATEAAEALLALTAARGSADDSDDSRATSPLPSYDDDETSPLA